MTFHLNLVLMMFLLLGWKPGAGTSSQSDYSSNHLAIEKLSKHVYRHISFLKTDSFGKVACNGMVVIKDGDAIIFDTPASQQVAEELIQWVEEEMNSKIKAIIPTHFHLDCLGGLEAFHQKHIPSYANTATIQMAQAKGSPVPQRGFDPMLELQVGNLKVLAEFLGEGHTQDNVIGYFPEDKVLFGGCLVKKLGAGKGNLEDANEEEWSTTVSRLKEKYPETQYVIPGHGNIGGTELLDYTIQLFSDSTKLVR